VFLGLASKKYYVARIFRHRLLVYVHKLIVGQAGVIFGGVLGIEN